VKIDARKIAKRALAVTAGAVTLGLVFKLGFWASGAFGVASHVKGATVGLEELVGHPLESVQSKVDQVAKALDENERLRLENAHLKLRVETLQFDCHQKRAAENTKTYELKLDPQTGSRVGRTLASIGYRIPDQLSADQLYVLGVSYFKSEENEKAAAILTFLTNLENNHSFRNPRDWLMTGVAWYRLDNFDAAAPFFDQVLEATGHGENEDTKTYHAQALVWKSLIAERTGKPVKAQYWLRELLDHHPYSREAEWVNGRGGLRAPAQTHHPKEGKEAHEGE
jgi:tetratricopeptide (TPR) repeat protein